MRPRRRPCRGASGTCTIGSGPSGSTRIEPILVELARELGLDVDRFERDLASDEVRERVEEDRADGQASGVTGTPTLFVDGIRYDGAWDFHSMLEALDRPVAARVRRSARVFASLPTSAGLVLLLAAAAALACANGPRARLRALRCGEVRDWPGVVSARVVRPRLVFGRALVDFFSLVGLAGEARDDGRCSRVLARGAPSRRRRRRRSGGASGPLSRAEPWPDGSGLVDPDGDDIAFTLGILAVLGHRVPSELRVLVAALAVVDDGIPVATLAIFTRRGFEPLWLIASAVGVGALALRTARGSTPSSVHHRDGGPLALPPSGRRSCGARGRIPRTVRADETPPDVGALLAQGATALAALEQVEREAAESPEADSRLSHASVWDWALICPPPVSSCRPPIGSSVRSRRGPHS